MAKHKKAGCSGENCNPKGAITNKMRLDFLIRRMMALENKGQMTYQDWVNEVDIAIMAEKTVNEDCPLCYGAGVIKEGVDGGFQNHSCPQCRPLKEKKL